MSRDRDLEAIEATGRVLDEIALERVRQFRKHGDQSHLPMGTGPEVRLCGVPMTVDYDLVAGDVATWAKARCKAASQHEGGDGTTAFEHILTEEYAEAIAEEDPTRLRDELIQLAAVAVQMVEALDRRSAAARSA
jgi:hypothetical protein